MIISALKSAAGQRRWRGDWYQTLDDLDEAEIDEELAEMWYQTIKESEER